jgi:hypothetical protein
MYYTSEWVSVTFSGEYYFFVYLPAGYLLITALTYADNAGLAPSPHRESFPGVWLLLP